tara:strand:+ start:472 stop:1074 length:603 start_codon:yes stop_codon:yes gene_type:complete
MRIEIRGNADLRKAMRRFTPDLEKALKKELTRALKPVVTQAKGFVPANSPMSGWAGRSFNQGTFPTFNASTIKAGITYSTTPSKINENGFSSMARIENKSRVGAIYEGAGRANPQGQPWVGPKAGSSSNKYSKSSNPTAGKTFIENLPPLVSSLKGRGRIIYRAWAASQGKAESAAMKAIDTAATQFRSNVKLATSKKAA